MRLKSFNEAEPNARIYIRLLYKNQRNDLKKNRQLENKIIRSELHSDSLHVHLPWTANEER
jgi:hypothetical protein